MKKLIYAFSGTAQELRDKLECGFCLGAGVYHRQDGPDDYVDVKCLCQRSEDKDVDDY